MPPCVDLFFAYHMLRKALYVKLISNINTKEVVKGALNLSLFTQFNKFVKFLNSKIRHFKGARWWSWWWDYFSCGFGWWTFAGSWKVSRIKDSPNDNNFRFLFCFFIYVLCSTFFLLISISKYVHFMVNCLVIFTGYRMAADCARIALLDRVKDNKDNAGCYCWHLILLFHIVIAFFVLFWPL